MLCAVDTNGESQPRRNRVLAGWLAGWLQTVGTKKEREGGRESIPGRMDPRSRQISIRFAVPVVGNPRSGCRKTRTSKSSRTPVYILGLRGLSELGEPIFHPPPCRYFYHPPDELAGREKQTRLEVTWSDKRCLRCRQWLFNGWASGVGTDQGLFGTRKCDRSLGWESEQWGRRLSYQIVGRPIHSMHVC